MIVTYCVLYCVVIVDSWLYVYIHQCRGLLYCFNTTLAYNATALLSYFMYNWRWMYMHVTNVPTVLQYHDSNSAWKYTALCNMKWKFIAPRLSHSIWKMKHPSKDWRGSVMGLHSVCVYISCLVPKDLEGWLGRGAIYRFVCFLWSEYGTRWIYTCLHA